MQTRAINGLQKVKNVKFIDLRGEKDPRKNTDGRELNVDGANVKMTVAEKVSGADWPSEGIGIEGSRVPTLLFELGSNDHEFKFVIMGQFKYRCR